MQYGPQTQPTAPLAPQKLPPRHQFSLKPEEVLKLRGSLGNDDEVAHKAYVIDPAFRKRTDAAMSVADSLSPSGRKKLATMLLNKHYFGDYHKDIKPSETTQAIVEQNGEPQENIFGKLKQRVSNAGQAVARHALGQQGAGETALQIMGQSAGGVNDIIGTGMSVAGKGIAAATPEPVKNAVKSGVSAVAESGPGQAVIGAAQDTATVYEGWKKQNPRAAADLEGIVNIASLLPVGKGVQAAGKSAVNAAAKSGIPQAAEKGLRESAELSIQRALGATTKEMKGTAARIAPEIASRPMSETFALTRQGLEDKARAGLEKAGEALEGFGKLKGKTSTRPVIDALETEKSQYVIGGKVADPAALDRIQKVQDLFLQYGDEIDREDLRSIRRLFDKERAQGKGFQKTLAEGSELDIKSTAANKIREVLASENPDLAKLNKEYSFWKGFTDVVSETNKRTASQTGLMPGLAGMAGAATGGGVVGALTKGLVFRWMAQSFRSSGWRLLSARVKNSIADAISVDDFTSAAQILDNAAIKGTEKFNGEWKQIQQRSGESRLINYKGQNQGTPGIDYPADPPSPGSVRQSQQGVMTDSQTTGSAGIPKEFEYIRNTEKSAKTTNMAQDIEPAGKYMTMAEPGTPKELPKGWERGRISFDKPLIIEWGNAREGGWKTKLSEMFGGKKGKALSKAITDAGYDGIITVDGNVPQEIVSLRQATQ